MPRSRLLAPAALLAFLACGGAPAQAQAPACDAPQSISRLEAPLQRLATRVRNGLPVRIVAFGSSSTEGIGASTPANSYPARLEAYLRKSWPGVPVRVVNKGIGGETEVEMMRRLDTDVLAQDPDLVVWQVGSNAVIRDASRTEDERLISAGVRRLKEAGIDVVLMDLQYAPEILRHRDWNAMVRHIAEVGRSERVPVFRRFAIMHHWIESGTFDMARMISPDKLHMNDASYGCLARLLARALDGEAARPAAIADIGPRATR